MQLNISLSISVLIILVGILYYIYRINRKAGSGLNILTATVFLASVAIFIPIYSAFFANDNGKYIKTFLLSLHNAIRLFIVDGEFTIITDFVGGESGIYAAAYSLLAAILFVLAPILTFSYVLAIFKNINATIRCFLGFGKDMYIFSEMNGRSLALAKSLKEHNRKRLIIFTDVCEGEEERPGEMSEAAKELDAILLKRDITLLDLKFHSKKAGIFFFLLGNNEHNNLMQAMKLVSQYKDRDNTNLYLFSTRIESEVITSAVEKGKMKIRRINPSRALVENMLYKNGTSIFDSAVETQQGEKKISALILGLGSYGTDMLKALSWYLQMDGYESEINCFDIAKDAKDKFKAMCPELLDKKLNKKKISDEAQYNITIHPGVNVEGMEFIGKLREIESITYVFIALGSDELNVRMAIHMRTICERLGIKPIIQAVLKNKELANALNGISNYRKQLYEIQFLGDDETTYSEEVIMESELEDKALKLHRKWGAEEEFWAYEYNYHSSVASVIHMQARIHCQIPGADKYESELTDREKQIIQCLEHKRWNAYMRSEGYIYSGSTDKNSRNDLGKMHNNLVGFDYLSNADKEKDSKVGTK